MAEIKKRSPCAGCEEVYEVDWPEAVAFYCGGGLPWGERVLIETQRLKHPRGCQAMITEGPLEGCPRGYKVAPAAQDSTSFAPSGHLPLQGKALTEREKARDILERALLERALREKEAV